MSASADSLPQIPPLDAAGHWANTAMGRRQSAVLSLWEMHHAIDNEVAKYYVLMAIAALAEGAAGQAAPLRKAPAREM